MPNRLAEATSPYLLQHADNPVDWYPWGEEALAAARERDVPILLSVGYAACHWCHVMERESFEDEDTAALMNRSFVSVKVDREERPDVDAIYMDAVQAMTGHGGWPMTVFLTPDGEPFYAGTYFPPEPRFGMPSFRQVLEAIETAWRDRRAEAVEQGRRVAEALSHGAHARESTEPLTEDLLRGAHRMMSRAFDAEWGGFGGAPKFPQPMSFEFLVRAHLRGYPDALGIVTTTLDRMWRGGMYDHLGGGFHRYSTDRVWLVPHFEKMLYDNAQLARLYLRGWQVTGNEDYRRVCTETLEYLLREMRHPGGGFFSAQDADSEGVEGKFFVWSWDELVSLVGEDAAEALGASPEGNWEGTNVLHRPGETDPGDDARKRLFDERETRVRPATDDKVLAGWNGLAIAAFAEAGRALDEARYVEAAEGAASFALSELRRDDGRLLRAWREGRTSGPAYADDHAMLAAGLLTVFEATADLRWIRACRDLAHDLLTLFRDADGGGFFQTGTDQEQLVVRPKELFDNAVPSANSMAADLLLRLALLSGDAEYERAAASALRAARPVMERAPTGAGHALVALDLYLGPSREIAIVGSPGLDDARPLLREAWRRFLPRAVIAAGVAGDPAAAEAVPVLGGRGLVDGRAAAYVCERFACKRPVTEAAELAALLDAP